jgi:hypothetical protein
LRNDVEGREAWRGMRLRNAIGLTNNRVFCKNYHTNKRENILSSQFEFSIMSGPEIQHEEGNLSEKEKIQAAYFLQELNFNNENIKNSEKSRYDINTITFAIISAIAGFIIGGGNINFIFFLFIGLPVIFLILLYVSSLKKQMEMKDIKRSLRMCECEIGLSEIAKIDLKACRDRAEDVYDSQKKEILNMEKFNPDNLPEQIEYLQRIVKNKP